MYPLPAVAALAFLIAGCSAPARRSDASAESSDSAFRAVQSRGAQVMGVDQYTSAHVFEPLPNGGRIVLQREVNDSAGTATIRAHMADIAGRFSRGDFSLPGLVHARAVPGTDVMAARRSLIRYVADTLPRGGEVRIITSDSLAIAAVHEFLAFQRSDHHAGLHMPAGRR
jgi:hypothetical protein